MRNNAKVLKSVLTALLAIVLMLCVFAISDNENSFAAGTHLRKTKIKINVTKRYQQKLFDAYGHRIKATKVKWKSKNKKIAKINAKGKIIARKKGTAKMTARYAGRTYRFTVKVTNRYMKKDYRKLRKWAKNAMNCTDNVTNDVDWWEYYDYGTGSSGSYYVSRIKTSFKNAAKWFRKAKSITNNRKFKRVVDRDAKNQGYQNWKGMTNRIYRKCVKIKNTKVSNLSYYRRMVFAGDVLDTYIDIVSAYLEYDAAIL